MAPKINALLQSQDSEVVIKTTYKLLGYHLPVSIKALPSEIAPMIVLFKYINKYGYPETLNVICCIANYREEKVTTRLLYLKKSLSATWL